MAWRPGEIYLSSTKSGLVFQCNVMPSDKTGKACLTHRHFAHRMDVPHYLLFPLQTEWL